MAYNIFPTTVAQLRTNTKTFSAEAQGELFLLFDYLKKKFPKLETPINLDASEKRKANVSRAIENDITIRTITRDLKLTTIKLKFGNGSSGNRGVNNRGNLFETEFADALKSWWKGDTIIDRQIHLAIEDLDQTYGIRKWKELKVDVVGGENTPRPLKYIPKIALTNPKGVGYDVGKSVTDITISDGTTTNEVYLSLKLGATVTFFNVGLRTTPSRTGITPDAVKAYNITGEGLKLLETFKIDPKSFCDVFNQKLDRGFTEDVNPTELTELLKTGIGEGYHVIHKVPGKIISKKMDRAALDTASRVGSAKVYYGGKGGNGRRIDYVLESSTYKFQLNIRDTQGRDGYPTRLMCNFSYK
jgi:hypothetical protein